MKERVNGTVTFWEGFQDLWNRLRSACFQAGLNASKQECVPAPRRRCQAVLQLDEDA